MQNPPMQKAALISACGHYRYTLTRTWDPTLPVCVFLMLNPSTADGLADDPTITKCIGFATRWGYGGILVVNLFAYRATKPADLWKAPVATVGPDNPRHLAEAVSGAACVVAAWGGNATHRYAAEHTATVWSWLQRVRIHNPPQCLGLTQDGQPRHPLMLAYATPLQRLP